MTSEIPVPTVRAAPVVFAFLFLATMSGVTALASVSRTREAIERLLHRRNNAVLEHAGLSSPGTKLKLVDRDEDESPYLASYQVRRRGGVLCGLRAARPNCASGRNEYAVDHRFVRKAP